MNVCGDVISNIAGFLRVGDLRALRLTHKAALPDSAYKELVKNQFAPIFKSISCESNSKTWFEHARNIMMRWTYPMEVYDRENNAMIFKLSVFYADVHYANYGFIAHYLADSRCNLLEKFRDDSHLRQCVYHNVYFVAPFPAKGFVEGELVEMQWRYNPEWCFGWWIGYVLSISASEIVVDFPHFSRTSRWRNVRTAIKCGKFVEAFHDGASSGAIRKLSKDHTKRAKERELAWS